MFDSILFGEPSSKSNWLNRLRLSKGFPLDSTIDPSSSNNCYPNSNQVHDSTVRSDSNPPPITRINLVQNTISSQTGESENDLCKFVSSVLSELFVMRNLVDFQTVNGRRSFRKQSYPRVCMTQESGRGEDRCLVESQRVSDLLSTIPCCDVQNVPETKNNLLSINRDEDNSKTIALEKDLLGFSCSEVTIIDTSYSTWKSGKLIFRKGNFWKIRNKKNCSTDLSIDKKKKKLLYVARDAIEKEDQNQKKRKVASTESQDVLDLVMRRKRRVFPRLKRKSTKYLSLIFNAKPMPRSTKN